MAGSDIATVSYAFKKALFDAATTLFEDTAPEFEVVWGALGTRVPEQYVQILGVDVGQEPATMSSNRSREETLRIETQWYCTIRGEVDAAREAEEYVFARIRELERHVRMVDTSLGGVVRECSLAAAVVDSTRIQNQNTSVGRLGVALVIFEAKARVTG
jgi:hypothetical protein